MLLGVHLQLLMGSTITKPVTSEIIQSIQSIEVTNNIGERSVFQITFGSGKNASWDLFNHSIDNNPLLEKYNRVQIIIYFGLTPEVLFDGIITDSQSIPSDKPGRSTFKITGEDLSFLLDNRISIVPYPNMKIKDIVTTILGPYLTQGLLYDVTGPPNDSSPNDDDIVRKQDETDLTYLQRTARENHYVFYIEPGPVPGMNTAYWGPSDKFETLQEPLSVNMGPDTNVVGQLPFQDSRIKQTRLEGYVQDRHSNEIIQIQSGLSTRNPNASESPGQDSSQKVKTKKYVADGGLDSSEASNQAQAEFENSIDCTVTASGDLDPVRYGRLLRVKRKVIVRGVEDKNNGLYDVKSVTTTIKHGSINQNFVLCREGAGSTRRNAS